MTLRNRISSSFRIWWFRGRGIVFSPNTQIGPGVVMERGFAEGSRGSISAGSGLKIEPGAVLHAHGGRIDLGRNVFLGHYTVIYGQGGVDIGDNSLISMHCRILSSNHTIPPIGTSIRSQPDVHLPTRIGQDVWLGAGVTIVGGVTIGAGCVVGAGAVVTKDLPAGAVAVGNPARILRHRALQ